jgi:hypothetical protein
MALKAFLKDRDGTQTLLFYFFLTYESEQTSLKELESNPRLKGMFEYLGTIDKDVIKKIKKEYSTKKLQEEIDDLIGKKTCPSDFPWDLLCDSDPKHFLFVNPSIELLNPELLGYLYKAQQIDFQECQGPYTRAFIELFAYYYNLDVTFLDKESDISYDLCFIDPCYFDITKNLIENLTETAKNLVKVVRKLNGRNTIAVGGSRFGFFWNKYNYFKDGLLEKGIVYADILVSLELLVLKRHVSKTMLIDLEFYPVGFMDEDYQRVLKDAYYGEENEVSKVIWPIDQERHFGFMVADNLSIENVKLGEIADIIPCVKDTQGTFTRQSNSNCYILDKGNIDNYGVIDCTSFMPIKYETKLNKSLIQDKDILLTNKTSSIKKALFRIGRCSNLSNDDKYNTPVSLDYYFVGGGIIIRLKKKKDNTSIVPLSYLFAYLYKLPTFVYCPNGKDKNVICINKLRQLEIPIPMHYSDNNNYYRLYNAYNKYEDAVIVEKTLKNNIDTMLKL